MTHRMYRQPGGRLVSLPSIIDPGPHFVFVREVEYSPSEALAKIHEIEAQTARAVREAVLGKPGAKEIVRAAEEEIERLRQCLPNGRAPRA